jgi:hypothetical protein
MVVRELKSIDKINKVTNFMRNVLFYNQIYIY